MQEHVSTNLAGSIRPIPFLAGWLCAIIAFVTPMDAFGMYSMFTVHMAQHLLLSLAAPPLILLGIAPERLERSLALHPWLQRVLAVLTIPVLASLVFNGNIWLWHSPLMMAVMMGDSFLHDATNLLYLVTGLMFWCPLFGLTFGRKPLSLAAKLFYLFFSDMPMMLIGAGLTFSPPLYTFTMAEPLMRMKVTATDQQLGGLLMWVVGGVFLLVVVSSILFLPWMLQQEKMQQEQDRILAVEQEDDEKFYVSRETADARYQCKSDRLQSSCQFH